MTPLSGIDMPIDPMYVTMAGLDLSPGLERPMRHERCHVAWFERPSPVEAITVQDSARAREYSAEPSA